MIYAKPMRDAYPRPYNVDVHALARATEASVDCAQACTACPLCQRHVRRS